MVDAFIAALELKPVKAKLLERVIRDDPPTAEMAQPPGG